MRASRPRQLGFSRVGAGAGLGGVMENWRAAQSCWVRRTEGSEEERGAWWVSRDDQGIFFFCCCLKATGLYLALQCTACRLWSFKVRNSTIHSSPKRKKKNPRRYPWEKQKKTWADRYICISPPWPQRNARCSTKKKKKKNLSHIFFTVNSSKAKALKSGSLLWFSITNYSVIFLQGHQVKFWFILWKSWKALLMLPLALLTATIFGSSGIAAVEPSAIFSRSLFLCRFSLLSSCAESASMKTVTLAYILERWLMKRIWIWNFKGELNSDPHLRDPGGALRMNWCHRRGHGVQGLSVLIFSSDSNNREGTKQQNSICLPLSIPIHLCPQTY